MKYVDWENGCSSAIDLDIIEINRFNARGMKRIYGRGDHFAKSRVYNMDIWINKDFRIFMRFWSKDIDAYELSFEIKCINLNNNLKLKKAFKEERIPKIIKEEYENWISDCY